MCAFLFIPAGGGKVGLCVKSKHTRKGRASGVASWEMHLLWPPPLSVSILGKLDLLDPQNLP